MAHLLADAHMSSPEPAYPHVGADEAAMAEMVYAYRHGNFELPLKHDVDDALRDSALSTVGAVTAEELFVQAKARRGPSATPRQLSLDDRVPALHGLSLSGGGIRSAAFCMGAVEALASLGVLSKFHFVSSVSGGGYTAGWLAAWSYRHDRGIASVERALQASHAKAPDEIKHVQRYVAYLAPGGSQSADIWTLLSAYSRNLVITLSTTLPTVFLFAVLPWLATLFISAFGDDTRVATASGWLFVASLVLTLLLSRVLAEQDSPGAPRRRIAIIGGVAGAGTLMGGASTAELVHRGGIDYWLEHVGTAEASRVPLLLALAVAIVVVVSQASTGLRFLQEARTPNLFLKHFQQVWRQQEDSVREMGATTISLVVALAAAWGLIDITASWNMAAAPAWAMKGGALTSGLVSITLAPLLWSVCLQLGISTLQALLSRQLDDGYLEWMARFAGLCLKSSFTWLVLCLVSIWAPPLATASGALCVGLALVGAMILARWVFPSWSVAIATTLGAAFCMILIGFASWRLVMNRYSQGDSTAGITIHLFIVACVLVVAGWWFGNLVNINRFSMHALYRDRLVRTFLGASRRDGMVAKPHDIPSDQHAQFSPRAASPFHDFDPKDNPPLHWLRSDGRKAAPFGTERHWMPVFLFNAALNKTWFSNEPGRRSKAFPFSFSPFYCGSSSIGFCETADYVKDEGGVSLGTAMATSGAALSSRSGRFDNPVSSFILTLMNLRLGTWLGNPANPRTRARAAPGSSYRTALAELLGLSSGSRDWVHLSDGGHFENLGTFELLRRGCRRIVAIDGSADPKQQFDDLATLIRTARDELNIDIKPVSKLQLGTREMQSGRYAALFSVHYPEGRRGMLLYVKPAFYEKTSFAVPVEVRSYAAQAKMFPHEPTTRQFFSAEQFDAYRSLGEHEILTIFAGAAGTGYDLAELFEMASQHIGDAIGTEGAASEATHSP